MREGTISYNAIVKNIPDLPFLKLFNHGTESVRGEKNTGRVITHYKGCELSGAIYDCFYEKEDRVFGNMVIKSGYDKVFVSKVFAEMKKHHPDLVINTLTGKYKNIAAKLSLSGTECLVLPESITDDEIKAAVEVVNNDWYFIDESIRVVVTEDKEDSELCDYVKYEITSEMFLKYIVKNPMKLVGKRIMLVNYFNNSIIHWLKALNCEVVFVYFRDCKKNKELGNKIKEELYKDKYIDMKFDYIIANPPYGRIGAEITKCIVDNLEFDTFLNLMPVNDYTRVGNIINHIIDMERLGYDVFSESGVTVDVSIARISKVPVNEFKNKQEFKEVFQFNNKLLKYYKANILNNNKFVSTVEPATNSFENMEKAIEWINSHDRKKSFLITVKSCEDGVHKEGLFDGYNTNPNFDLSNVIHTVKGKEYVCCGFSFLTFKTELEKNNFSEFWYRQNGHRLMSKFLNGLHKRGGECRAAIPQVDWSTQYSDNELLMQFGYSAEDIEYILSDEFSEYMRTNQ